MQLEKLCTKCGEHKELKDFSRKKRAEDGLYPSCKKCNSKDAKERKARNPEKSKETSLRASRKWHAKKRISIASHRLALLARQFEDTHNPHLIADSKSFPWRVEGARPLSASCVGRLFLPESVTVFNASGWGSVTPLGIVYCLYDPRTGEARYVGQTRTTISHRFSVHMCAARNNKGNRHCLAWLRALLSVGLQPVICALAFVGSETELDHVEAMYLAAAKRAGVPLTNHLAGGRGLAVEALKRKGQNRRGYKHSETTKSKISTSRMGRFRGTESPRYCHDVTVAVVLQKLKEGFSKERVAKELGVSVSVVSNRLKQADRDGVVYLRLRKARSM